MRNLFPAEKKWIIQIRYSKLHLVILTLRKLSFNSDQNKFLSILESHTLNFEK